MCACVRRAHDGLKPMGVMGVRQWKVQDTKTEISHPPIYLGLCHVPTNRPSPTQAPRRPPRWHATNMPASEHFPVYVTWPESRHSEPLTPETDENRLSAWVTYQPRPPSRLQSERKVTTQSNKWEIINI